MNLLHEIQNITVGFSEQVFAIDQQSRQEERSILPSTGYNFFGVAIFSPVLSDFGFPFERALSNHTFYYNYAPVYDNKPFLTTPPSHDIFVIT